jgi:hypothetical protein
VLEVLARFGVVVLQGPPHHPGFYGQLEHACAAMKNAFHSLLPRRRLGFLSAADPWFSRPNLALDRSAFHAEVAEIASRLERTMPSRDHAERFAIQAALATTVGRWTSKDPIVVGGGQMNLYAIPSNDPIHFRDYSGLEDVCGSESDPEKPGCE